MTVTLALDTSSRALSVAALRDDELLAELFIDAGRRHEETLVPAVEQVLFCSGLVMGDIDLFACCAGPGSFTGLRVGLATARGFAQATSKPLVTVSSLEALASNAMQGEGLNVCPMLDARRGEVYAACYGTGPDWILQEILAEQVLDPDALLRQIEGPTLFLGDGSRVYREAIHDRLGDHARFANPEADRPRASVIGRIGLKKQHSSDTLHNLAAAPRYLRPSYAGM